MSDQATILEPELKTVEPVPVEPVPVEPVPVEPVPVEPVPVEPVPVEPVPVEPELFDAPQPPEQTQTQTKQGCQCPECIARGSKAEKRGRHHKSCNCPACSTKKPAPASAVNADQPPQMPNPFDAVEQLAQTATVVAGENPLYGATAEVTFDSATGLLCMIFGTEWQAKNKDERQAVVDALTKYYKAKGITDLPPGALLALTVFAYSAPRLAHNNTRSKLVLAWHWTKAKVGGLFSKLFHRK